MSEIDPTGSEQLSYDLGYYDGRVGLSASVPIYGTEDEQMSYREGYADGSKSSSVDENEGGE